MTDHLAVLRELRAEYERLFDGEPVLAALDHAIAAIEQRDAGEVEARVPVNPLVTHTGAFGSFYTCPTCHGTGNVTQKVHDALTHPTPAQPVTDADLLDAIASEHWKLEPFDMPTPGGDDADVGWRVVEFHRAEPRERTVAEVYTDDPRAALNAARKGSAS